jgi:transposase
MASSGKRKTTMAKLARESRLRERRLEKKARKDARKWAADHPSPEPNGVDANGFDVEESREPEPTDGGR